MFERVKKLADIRHTPYAEVSDDVAELLVERVGDPGASMSDTLVTITKYDGSSRTVRAIGVEVYGPCWVSSHRSGGGIIMNTEGEGPRKLEVDRSGGEPIVRVWP
ncbi:MAG: hypothetical protein M0R06_10120 [Sphaerochaeta sp.]|jgi:hypothetical protein|nr:hypothetical protein [Sphaerochaeta sp.]